MSDELDEQVVEVLYAKRARLADEINTKRKQRELIDEKIRKAEMLMEAYEVVLQAHCQPVVTSEQQLLGAGVVEVFAPEGNLEIETEIATPTQPTVADAITALLVERNRAMHADELVVELRERGMRLSAKDPKASVVTALVRGARKGIFEKVGPNKYRETLQGGDA